MREYISPELEVIEFSEEDVIRTSILTDGGDSGEVSGDGDMTIWSLD